MKKMQKRSIKRTITTAIVMLITSMTLTAGNNFTIVIDAGHGGYDKGAKGSYSLEKDINLSVALKLGALLSDNCKNVDVVYTRTSDKYLTLQERADKANKANGDLFISIHTNSVDGAGRERVRGAATYTLGLYKTEENFAVAKRENSVIELEKDYTKTYHGFDPNSTESYIIFEITQDKHMQQSVKLAQGIQQQLVKTADRSNKGVRQAGFWVLAKTTMPSVLVELGFICNPNEEAFLNSKKGQEELAQAMYNAIVEYKSGIDKQRKAASRGYNSKRISEN
jgi:N-acetylmuramoyl-L-alanine amidase